MIRLVVWLGLAVLAFVAIGAEVDRQSRYMPQLARHVPAPFQSFALAHETAAALDHGENRKALALARQLVRQRPIPAENLTLLAMAELANGKEAAGLQTISLAGERGWRVWPLQVTMLQIAMAEHDNEEAAKRLAAMWAIPEDRMVIDDYTAALLSTPEGREAFAVRLAEGGIWTRAFVQRAQAPNAAANDATVLERAETISSAER
ncbi:MAG: hypothetical protein KDE63_03350 [Novosphingobium sp.]|nr:hypothetical protein [Novosphingobium sp.]